MRIITRAEAKERGLVRYFTGKPCSHGHVAERTVCDKTCYECKKIKSPKRAHYRRSYYLKHAERLKRKQSNYNAKVNDLLAVMRLEMPDLMRELGL